MSFVALLSEVRHQGIRLRVEGDHLRFIAPSGKMTAELRARLAEKKAELIQLLSRPSAAAPNAISKKSRNDHPAPASFAQERLWFLCRFDPGGPSPNLPIGWRWPGPLNVEALERSLSEIVRRHEALRTSFVEIEGRPRQLIASPTQVTVNLIDLRAIPETERELEAQRLAAAEGSRHFDLTTGPLFSATLVRLADADHLLLITTHHLISDGWSLGLLNRELQTFYEAFAAGRHAALPELPLQYADFARWQRDRLQGESLEELLGYWRAQLASVPELLELPADRPRPPVQSHSRIAGTFGIAPGTTSTLRSLAKAEDATLFMVLLAAFKVLLYRLSGQDDLVVGTPIANRNHAEIEGLIGFFVNTLLLRVDLSADPTFREVLRRARQVTLGAYAHQDLPFERLVEDLKPERYLDHHPLFQVMFALQNTPSTGNRHDSGYPSQAATGPAQVGIGAAKLDLSMFMTEVGDSLSGLLEGTADLFDSETVDRWIRHFESLLLGIARDPDSRLSELPLLLEEERQQLLNAWISPSNDPAAVFEPVHRAFEIIAARHRDRAAISVGDEVTTYGELEIQSNRIAHSLLGPAATQRGPVAILQSVGAARIASMLGVLKAGSPFACLDPGHPETRLAQVLAELSPAALICDGAVWAAKLDLLKKLSAEASIALLIVDQERGESEPTTTDSQIIFAEQIAAASTSTPNVVVTESDSAYLAFTSGSTGRPKGIVQSHGAFQCFLDWFGRRFELAAPQRVAQWATITFDPAYAEIFGSLTFGSTLCLVSDDQRSDPRAVVQWLRQQRVSLLQMVPSFLRQLLQALETVEEIVDPDPLPDLRFTLFAGEMLPKSLARAWQRRMPASLLSFNLYGPTEAIVATCYELGEITEDHGSVPVGVPIDGCRVVVVDAHDRPCPIGVPGEVVVKSRCLTRGYLNPLQHGSGGFVPDPLLAQGGAVYRTADLGRWLADGNLKLQGRADNQVKIRGQRVELEEVEATLGCHPLVTECAVVVHRFDDVDQRLAAYVSGVDTGAVGEIREYLRRRLLAYMVPSSLVCLEALPRTTSGKIDRRALPLPQDQDQPSRRTFNGPSNNVEAHLAEIFSSLLRVEKVSVDDDFFELGGHSLLATQAVNAIREAFAVEIPLRRFFEQPTVAGLALDLGAAGKDLERLRRLCTEIEALSDNEVRRQLIQMEGRR